MWWWFAQYFVVNEMSCCIRHMSRFWSPDEQNSGNEIHIPYSASYMTKMFTCSILYKIETKLFMGTLFWNSEFSSKHTFFVMLRIHKYVNNTDQWSRLESLKGTNYTAYLLWSIILRPFIKERWNVRTDSRSSYSHFPFLPPFQLP